MTKKEAIKIFEEKKVRTLWDDETEEWYFSVVDVVGVLTGSVDPAEGGRERNRDKLSRFENACIGWEDESNRCRHNGTVVPPDPIHPIP